MQRLTGMDASFLYLETPTNHMHVAATAVFDPTTVPGGYSFEKVLALIDSRLHLLPPFRRRLVEVPFQLHHPLWIEDPDFDLEYHVRELALPPPGTNEQLAEQVARIVSRPLDRARPLWELYLIHGLKGGHKAVMTKIHHSVIDGMSGAEIMGALLDLTPEGREVPEDVRFSDDGEPSELGMLGRGLLGLPRYPLRVLRALPATLPNLDETPLATLPGAGTLRRIASSVQRAVGGGGGVFRAIFITLVVLDLVASFQAFGTLLAIGPMLLPAAAARCWTQKVWPMIALATAIGMAAALAGLLISYYANLPSGPAIVIGAGLIYGISLLAAGRTRFEPRISGEQR